MCHPLIQRRTKESAGRPAAILVIAASLIACGSTAFAQDMTAGVIRTSAELWPQPP